MHIVSKRHFVMEINSIHQLVACFICAAPWSWCEIWYFRFWHESNSFSNILMKWIQIDWMTGAPSGNKVLYVHSNLYIAGLITEKVDIDTLSILIDVVDGVSLLSCFTLQSVIRSLEIWCVETSTRENFIFSFYRNRFKPCFFFLSLWNFDRVSCIVIKQMEPRLEAQS